MTTIHENNCEAFFLDYYEGRLDDTQQQLLFSFLGENPEWKNVFEEYGEVIDAEVVLNSDENASMSATDQPPLRDEEDDLIALLEGQLNDNDAQILQHLIERETALANAYRQYELTRLKPDLSVVYPDKQDLKKGAPIVSLFARYSAVAALMAGAFIAVWIFSNRETTENIAEYIPRTNQNKTSTESALNFTEKTTVFSPAEQLDKSTAQEKSPVPALANAALVKNQNDHSNSGKTVQKAVKSPEKIPPQSPRFVRVELESMGIKTQSGELMASIDVEQPRLVKSDLPNRLPKTKAIQPAINTDNDSRSLFGAFLSEVGQSLVDRVKTATDEDVVIETEKHPEEELVTSTFKLGAFEVYRSKSKK